MGKENLAVAFNPEFYSRESRQKKELERTNQIRDDLVSYLGEYRFETGEFNYRLRLEGAKILDPNSTESMLDKAKKAIKEREKKDLPTNREEAEVRGILSLERQLERIDKGTIIWFSPPGPREQGYGDYGFVYVGSKREYSHEIEMTAIRIEKPGEDEMNRVLSEISGRKIELIAEDFLSEPAVSDISVEDARKIIESTFPVKETNSKTEIFNKAIKRMGGVIEQAVELIKNGTAGEKQKAIYTLENLAIQIRGQMEEGLDVFHIRQSINDLIPNYSFTPPKVAGSCGSSSNQLSSFRPSESMLSFLDEDEFGPRAVVCPSCGKINIRPRGELISHCQHCNSTEIGCE